MSSSRPKPSQAIVLANIRPAAPTPTAKKPPLNNSPSRAQHVPLIDLAAGPLADEQDTHLDTDIAALRSRPTPAPINTWPFIPERDAAWNAHISYLRAWHAIELRIIASEERATHRIIVRELKATHAEELQGMRDDHEKDLLREQEKFAELFGGLVGEKNGELERVVGEREMEVGRVRALEAQLGQVREDAAQLHQLILAQASALQSASLSNTGSSVAVHHPNNVARAKHQRLQQPVWSSLENLVQSGGGLPIRPQRIDLGLPTPRDERTTVKIVREVDWNVGGGDGGGVGIGGIRTPDSAPLTPGRYERGNGEVTRSGRLIDQPRSARTVQEVEWEMMLQPREYDPFGGALSAGGVGRARAREEEMKREKVLGELESEIEMEVRVREGTDAAVGAGGAGKVERGPGPSVPNSACEDTQTRE